MALPFALGWYEIYLVKVAVSGVSAEDGPARIVYSPGIISIVSLLSLYTERQSGLRSMVTVFDSPGARLTRSKPTRRL